MCIRDVVLFLNYDTLLQKNLVVDNPPQIRYTGITHTRARVSFIPGNALHARCANRLTVNLLVADLRQIPHIGFKPHKSGGSQFNPATLRRPG